MVQKAAQTREGNASDEIAIEELQATCGRTIAFVLAANESAASRMEDVGRVACRAQMPAVFLLADACCADEATQAMRRLQRKGRGMVQALALEFAAMGMGSDADAGTGTGMNAGVSANRDADADAGMPGNLPASMLEAMRTLAESVLDVYEAVVVLDAAQAEPTVPQLHDLCRGLDARSTGEGSADDEPASCDPPCIIGRASLESLR